MRKPIDAKTLLAYSRDAKQFGAVLVRSADLQALIDAYMERAAMVVNEVRADTEEAKK